MMKKLWNKILTAMLALTVLVCPLMAQADVVWEPKDSFWESHQEECEYQRRRYQVSGKAIVYKSPENDKVVKKLDDGHLFWSDWSYTDANGNEWLFYEREKVGWVPKASLEVIYDYISFENEFADQIREESGMLDEQYLEETVYFWDYPGSLEKDWVNFDDYEDADLPAYQKMFTDEGGHEWGYVGYWCGYRDFWICLDKPTFALNALYNGNIPERGVKIDGENPVVVEKLIDPAEVEKVVPAEDGSNLLVNFVVTVLVAGVIIITAVILRTMKKKNNRRQS